MDAHDEPRRQHQRGELDPRTSALARLGVTAVLAYATVELLKIVAHVVSTLLTAVTGG